MAYGTRIEEVEQASSSRKKVMKAFGYTVCALAVVACLLVATGSQVSTVDVLEEQSAEFSVLNAPAKPVGKAAAHTASSAHSSAHHSEVAHASAAHASAAHASAAHASAAHASAAHASAAHAPAAHASAAHAPAAAAHPAGVKSATTTTTTTVGAPVAKPSSAAAVVLSVVSVACTVMLAL